MAVFYNIDQLPQFKNAVITIGTFDGVHKGHTAILQEVVRHARNVSGESVLLTFEPHPRKLLFPNQPLGIITPLASKLDLVTATGIEHIVVVPFTREFAGHTAKEYIENFLVARFQPHSIIIGYDHRFGQDRAGDIKLLEYYEADFGYELMEIPAQLIDEAAVSSTKIRHAIQGGRLEEAAQMLGRPYALAGKVVHGKQLGRTIGYPTANIDPTDKDQIVPANGIYAIQALCAGALYGGMLSIGLNPTVTDTTDVKIEAHLFDFAADIYDQVIEIRFLKKLRDEQKFASLDALKEQLHLDKINSLACL